MESVGDHRKNRNKPIYHIQGGLRKVEPYDFTYTSFAKKRWIGKQLLDILKLEFYQITDTYYELAIKSGKITINGEIVSCQHVIKEGEVLCHTIHRHEPPVLSSEVRIIYEDDVIIVVNKPPSIPVHATGRYMYNSLIEILKHKLMLLDIKLVHRLDRLTSGVCIIARNKETTRRLSEQLRSGEFDKTYIAMVRGKFPDGKIVCNKGIKVISAKLALSVAADDGKPCSTTFRLTKYDGTRSMVECRPKTGRTHQIRIHLQYLGYPIFNDPVYASDLWPASGKEQCYSEQQISEILTLFAKRRFDHRSIPQIPEHHSMNVDMDLCYECLIPRLDPKEEDLYMCLHSWKYTIGSQTFEADLPEWAF